MPTTPRIYDPECPSRVARALVASVVIHLIAGLALLGRQEPGGGQSPLDLAPSLPEREDPLVRPGITQSRAVTINWLGFESPTEHQAEPADSEQAALSPTPTGTPVPEDARPSPAPPVEGLAEADAAEERPEPESAREPAKAAPAEPAEDVPSPDAAAELAVPEGLNPEVLVAPLVDMLRSIARNAREANERVDAAASPAPAAAPAATPGEAREAIPSEKESSATSVDPVDWEPGRPVAAEGLDITPVVPEWNISTRLSSLPRNPVVQIEFAKDGRVRRVGFIGEGTGYRDVDGPLLDAIYRWRAKGEALDRLPQGDPEATVSLTMRIVLVRPPAPVRRGSPSR